jgi:PHS family inorganic phosphate transporter-like MFS transporter
MLAYIFANQGWGSLVGSVVTIVVLSIYKPVMNGEGHTSKVDGGRSYLLHPPRPRIVADWLSFVVWRIVIGLSLIPAFGTLYQRLTLPESKRFIASQKRPEDAETFEKLKEGEKDVKVVTTPTEEDASNSSPTKEDSDPDEVVKHKAHFSGKRAFGH